VTHFVVTDAGPPARYAAAPSVVAALDGLILDALVRGGYEPERLRAAVERILGLR